MSKPKSKFSEIMELVKKDHEVKQVEAFIDGEPISVPMKRPSSAQILEVSTVLREKGRDNVTMQEMNCKFVKICLDPSWLNGDDPSDEEISDLIQSTGGIANSPLIVESNRMMNFSFEPIAGGSDDDLRPSQSDDGSDTESKNLEELE